MACAQIIYVHICGDPEINGRPSELVITFFLPNIQKKLGLRALKNFLALFYFCITKVTRACDNKSNNSEAYSSLCSLHSIYYIAWREVGVNK